MNDHARWLQDNDRALSNALEDLRARLRALAGTEAPGASPGPGPGGAGTSDASGSALSLLCARLGLSAFERDVLLLCMAAEFDTGFPALFAQAQHDPARSFPTFALAMALADDPAWEAMSPQRPLRYWRLIEVGASGGQPLVSAALRADERIVNYAKGLNQLDDRLSSLLSPLPAGAAALPPSQQAVADALVAQLQATPPDRRYPLLQLLGGDSGCKHGIAHAVSARFGVAPYRLDAEMVPVDPGEAELLSRLWQRESLLLPVSLYVDAECRSPATVGGDALLRLLPRLSGLVFVDSREPASWGAVPTISVDVARPSVDEQRAAWRSALGAAAGTLPDRMAGQFDLGTDAIMQVAGTALRVSAASPGDLPDALWQGALARTRPAMDRLAQRILPVAGWDDLQLPAREKDTLREIAGQVAMRTKVYEDWGFRGRMNRGFGITALFAGESGTGKTMAAEVLAHELDLMLHRIDLSAVVSKYIGETGKNLRHLFDAAEEGGTILFFDEADALFGRRSEVRDSHDRYANIEVDYLLQRMESYRGLAILATNMKGALDAAFVRRLRFIVDFPFPGVAERRAMWLRAFPAQAEVGALDHDRLARLMLSGGSIQNIALNAAFSAARAGVPVTMPLLLEAARSEFRKLGKPVNEADFRWLESAGDRA